MSVFTPCACTAPFASARNTDLTAAAAAAHLAAAASAGGALNTITWGKGGDGPTSSSPASHTYEVVQGVHGHEAILWDVVWVKACHGHWCELVAHACFDLGDGEGPARRVRLAGQRAKGVAGRCEACLLVGAQGNLESVDALAVVSCRRLPHYPA